MVLGSGELGLFLAVAVCSMLMSLFVCFNVLRFGARTVSSRLILYINVTILMDCVASLPDAYIHHKDLCNFMAFMKSYSEIVNIMVAFLMIILAYNLQFPSSLHSRFVLTNSMNFFLFAFPLFLLIPLGTHSFGVFADHWCSFTGTEAGNSWFLGVLALDFSLIGASMAVFFTMLFKVAMSTDLKYSSLFKGVGMYSIITIILWLPKVLIVNTFFPSVFSVDFYMFVSRIVTYVTGMTYGIVFLRERDSLRLLLCCCCNDYEVLRTRGHLESNEFNHTDEAGSFYAESHVCTLRDTFLLSCDSDSNDSDHLMPISSISNEKGQLKPSASKFQFFK